MKVIVFENNCRELTKKREVSWYIVADSALSNVGKPFYIPENEVEVVVSLGIALKISKLGKYVEPRFASRYYREYAPVLHFCLPRLMAYLQENLLPISPAVSFDRSVMAGEWQELPQTTDNIHLSLKINGEVCSEWNSLQMIVKPQELLFGYSKMNTIKMGDVIVPSLSERVAIRQGDYLEVANNRDAAFFVKVK